MKENDFDGGFLNDNLLRRRRSGRGKGQNFLSVKLRGKLRRLLLIFRLKCETKREMRFTGCD
jgi:hypothetical protein